MYIREIKYIFAGAVFVQAYKAVHESAVDQDAGSDFFEHKLLLV